jgi:E3 ubiquitin-protein ligase SHPRH
VKCRSCGQSFHLVCLEGTLSSPSPSLGKYCDPLTQCHICIAQATSGGDSKIRSKSTLIVTPRPLTSQWFEEIKRHTTGLSVAIYEGVKEIKASKDAQTARMLLSNPLKLGQHDIVLTTFETLKEDLNHSNFNPYSAASGKREGRGGKRKVRADEKHEERHEYIFLTHFSRRFARRQLYPILPSPLTSIDWWRVCIDEAQRVSTPTAKSAMMALRLHSVNKWAVTGTPVSKNRMVSFLCVDLTSPVYLIANPNHFAHFRQTSSASCSFSINLPGTTAPLSAPTFTAIRPATN